MFNSIKMGFSGEAQNCILAYIWYNIYCFKKNTKQEQPTPEKSESEIYHLLKQY